MSQSQYRTLTIDELIAESKRICERTLEMRLKISAITYITARLLREGAKFRAPPIVDWNDCRDFPSK